MDDAYWSDVDAVEVVNICTVLDEVDPGWALHYYKTDYDARCKLVQKWVADHDAHYYAADNEDFSELTARREAHDLGKKLVVVENLS